MNCKKRERKMVTILHRTTIGQDGQLAIPDDIRRELGLKPGDSVELSLDNERILKVRPALLTFEDLEGSLPVLDRHVDDDFGNLIRKATEEAIERRLRRAGFRCFFSMPMSSCDT
jgi:AbrB family looped-hinge helix DNA binding protein